MVKNILFFLSSIISFIICTNSFAHVVPGHMHSHPHGAEADSFSLFVLLGLAALIVVLALYYFVRMKFASKFHETL